MLVTSDARHRCRHRCCYRRCRRRLRRRCSFRRRFLCRRYHPRRHRHRRHHRRCFCLRFDCCRQVMYNAGLLPLVSLVPLDIILIDRRSRINFAQGE